jgi:hypothetical protein
VSTPCPDSTRRPPPLTSTDRDVCTDRESQNVRFTPHSEETFLIGRRARRDSAIELALDPIRGRKDFKKLVEQLEGSEDVGTTGLNSNRITFL